jgi:hypothetical protein
MRKKRWKHRNYTAKGNERFLRRTRLYPPIPAAVGQSRNPGHVFVNENVAAMSIFLAVRVRMLSPCLAGNHPFIIPRFPD